MMRLNKFIASQGICSRRDADALIACGKVQVNGETVQELGTKVDPEKDSITIPSKGYASTVGTPARIAVLLNKPVDYITSTTSVQGLSIMDLLTPDQYIGKNKMAATERIANTRLYPVGRLDKDSEGLVLLTNDGDMTQKLTHPSFEHEKEYEVTIDKRFDKKSRTVLESGMSIGDQYVSGIQIKDVSNRGKRTIVTAILTEGKNRQIRKMFGRLGFHVLSLKRTRIAHYRLGTLPVGRWTQA
jgi:23S rRNA pseudouridine2605 synthase